MRMTNYEKILDNINSSDILYIKKRSHQIPAKSFRDEFGCAIFFDESAFETEAERFVALAHEKGHCDSGAFYNIHSVFETYGRCERRAWRQAVFEHLPLEKFMNAIEACKTFEGVNIYDLADFLDVTDEFIIKAIQEYICVGKLTEHLTLC